MRLRTLCTGMLLSALLVASVSFGKHVGQATEAKETLSRTIGRPTGEKGNDWPMFRRDLSRSGYTSQRLPPPLQLDWKYSTGKPVVSSPAVAHGSVCFGSRDSTLHVLNATTGKLIRKYKTKGWVDSSPAVTGGLIYFASRDGHIYAVARGSGGIRWKHHTGGTDCSSPALENGVLYVASGYPNTHLLSLDARSGERLWQYETSQPVYSSPAVKDGAVYVGSNDGKFYALNHQQPTTHSPASCTHLDWTFTTRGGVYFSCPAVSESLIYCVPGDYDKNIYCLRLSDGSVKWSWCVDSQKYARQSGGWTRPSDRIEGARSTSKDPDWVYPFVYVSSPALAHGLVYFVSGYPEQSLHALDALDGSCRWSQPVGQATGFGFSSSPAVADMVIYVGSGSGTLHAFDAASGSPLWSYDIGSPVLSSPAVAHKRLYVGTMTGDLYCFQAVGDHTVSAGLESPATAPVLPMSYALLPARPNPFTSTTTLPFAVPPRGGDTATRGAGDLSTYQPVNVCMYDLAGRVVKNLVDEPKGPGYHTATWDGTNHPGEPVGGGIYFCRMRVASHVFTQKLLLLRE